MESLCKVSLIILVCFVHVALSNFKLCCDKECTFPISLGRTKVRNTVRDGGYLTYPAGAKLTIWSKFYDRRNDVWEAELHGRRGLVKGEDIEESIVHCRVPEHWVPIMKEEDNKQDDIMDRKDEKEENRKEEDHTMDRKDEREENRKEEDHTMDRKDEREENRKEEDHTMDRKDEREENRKEEDHTIDHKDEREENRKEEDHTMDHKDEREENRNEVDQNEGNRKEVDHMNHKDEREDNSHEDQIEYNVEDEDKWVDEEDEEDHQIDHEDEQEENQFNHEYGLDQFDNGQDVNVKISHEDNHHVDALPRITENNIQPEAHVEQSETHTKQPETHFETHTVQPEIHTEQSETHSEAHTVQPEAHTKQPEAHAEQPEAHTKQPEPHIEQPKPHTEQPETHTDWTETPNDWTESHTDWTETQTYTTFTSIMNDITESLIMDTSRLQPVESSQPSITLIPTNTYNQPSDTYSQLSVTYNQPSDTYSQPLDTYSQPSDQPSDTYSQPSDTYSQPSDQPSDTYSQPSDTYSQPLDTYSQPSDTYSQPSDQPSDTYSQPSDTYSQPSDTYSQPSDQPLDTYSSDDEPMHSHYNPNDQSCPDNSQLLHTINKMFIKYIPFSSSLGPDASLIGIFVAFIAVCLPMTCSCCRSQRNISKVNKMLESERGHRKNVDAHIKNLTDSKVKLESDLKNLQVELKFCQENLENEKQGVWDLENIRANLELDKKNLLGWNEQTKQERDSFAVSIEQMKMEKEQADNQLSVILGERANMIEQISGMEKQLQYAIQLRQEAEAAKIQLEEDIYKIREDFDKLNEEHKKVSEEYDDVKGQYEERCDELMEVKDQLENTKEDNVNKDKELTILKECVQKLSEVDGEEMESKLGKIEAMLDTTRAQTDLREMKNERDKLKEELIAKEEVWRELEETNESLEDQLMNIKAENEKLTQELQETQQKFKGITEYFERKEVNLHKKIGQEEMVRLKVELREATAKEKAELAEQEREKEREELKELRKQMADIEKSLMQKVVINEKRAEESLTQLRRTEQELRVANKEVTMLKKKLEDLRPSPPSSPPLRPHLPMEPRPLYGPPPGPPPGVPLPFYQGIRPPKAPPLTSSPVNMKDKKSNDVSNGEDSKPRQWRPPPPGMESNHPASLGGRGYDPRLRPSHDRLDRPPIPGNRPPPPHPYYPPPPERQRPPSEPPYLDESIGERRRPPSNPQLPSHWIPPPAPRFRMAPPPMPYPGSIIRPNTTYPRPRLPPPPTSRQGGHVPTTEPANVSAITSLPQDTPNV